MTKSPREDNSSSAEDAFTEFLARREAAVAAGTAPPTLEEWLARYPQHEDSLRKLESDWRGFDALYRGTLGTQRETLFHRTPYDSLGSESFAELSPGREVGDFLLLERIGQGGMGEVWKAEQRSLRRQVALKFIRPDRLSPHAEAYFDREARASGRLNHPGIVAVHATGREGSLHWISQELVEGSSNLNDFLKVARSWDELPRGYFARVALLVAELCDALQAAHVAGVIHRDVKPHNVLITSADHPKLTDFGLARLTDEVALSGSYGVKGTPIYMSPEQIRGKTRLIDHRTDVYSTGSLLFELLTHHRLFEGDSSKSLARALTEDPPDPRTLRPDVPPELGAIALRALEHRPSDRYPTAAAMAEDLRAYLEHRPVRARPAGPVRRAQKWIRRHPAAAGVLALGLLMAGATYVLRDQVERAAERSEAAEKEVVLTRAWRAIDAGDLDGAAAEIDGFYQRFPDDPQGHLVMMSGFAGNSMYAEMEAEIAELGEFEAWDPASLDDQSAMGLFIQAMRWYATEGVAAYPRVQQNIERALELDPGLEVALFPLYQVRKAQGDFEGARRALEAYRGTLRTSDSGLRLVDALLSEFDGDLEGAIDRLETLRADVGDDEFLSLRGFVALGRVALLLYQQDPHGNRERLDEAERALSLAAESPVGASSTVWSNLGLVHLRKHDRTPNLDQRRERIALALECGRRAIELDRGDSIQWKVVVAAGMSALELADDPREQEQVRAQLEQDLAALEELDPDDPTLCAVQSDLLFRDGMAALAAADTAGAQRLFETSCERSPLQLNSRVMLAQLGFEQGRYEEALEDLHQAEETWGRLESRAANHPRRWLLAIYVWGVGCADHAQQVNLASRYLEQAREMLDSKEGLSLPEIITLAEFLATPVNDMLQDCDLVEELFEDFPLEETFGADHPDLVEKIRTACAR